MSFPICSCILGFDHLGWSAPYAALLRVLPQAVLLVVGQPKHIVAKYTDSKNSVEMDRRKLNKVRGEVLSLHGINER